MNRYALKTRSRTSPSRPILSPTEGIRNQLVGQSHATNQNRLRANTLPASTSEIRPTHRRRCDRRALAVGKGQWQDLVGGGYVADVARISCRIENDDPLAAEQLLPLVCDELRKLASAKLVRGHFFAAAAEAMRRMLVERARHNRSLKAGGDGHRQDLALIETVIAKPNVDHRPRRGFGKARRAGPAQSTTRQAPLLCRPDDRANGPALGISTSTADNDWAYARRWLRVEMEAQGATPGPDQIENNQNRLGKSPAFFALITESARNWRTFSIHQAERTA